MTTEPTPDPELKPGDRVRVPDGREGRLCWIIPTGNEAAVALDGVYGTFHIHPSKLERVDDGPWLENPKQAPCRCGKPSSTCVHGADIAIWMCRTCYERLLAQLAKDSPP